MTGGKHRAVAGLPARVAVAYAVLFAAALAVYDTSWQGAQVVDSDSAGYFEVARDLADGRLDAPHLRTVGYPLLLVLTGSTDHPTASLLLVSLLLHFASVWLLAAVLAAAGTSGRWLLAFGVALTLPPFVEPAAWVMTENLSEFGLVVGLSGLAFGIVRSRLSWIAVAGLAFGYTALTRPVYQALGLVLPGALAFACAAGRWPAGGRRALMKAAGVTLAGFALVLGGMAALNYARFSYVGPIGSAGFHLSTKMMPFIERLPDEYATARDVLVRTRDAELVKPGGTHTGAQTIWNARSELMAATGLSERQLSDYLLWMNLSLIRRAPLEYLQQVAASMAVYWFPPPTVLASVRSSAVRWVWAVLHLVVIGTFFLELVVLAGVGVFNFSLRSAGHPGRTLVPWRGVTPAQAWPYTLAGVVVLYTMLVTCLVDIGEPRQRRPTDVLVVFMCVLGAWIWSRAVEE